MNAAGHRIERIVICGGGTRNPLLLQEHADALGRDLHLVDDEDAVTLGAALLAAVAGGAFADLPAAAAAMVRPGGRVADAAQRPGLSTTPNTASSCNSTTISSAAASTMARWH